jgi:putative nucleotidyltransferase with HDIG domain
MSQSPALWARRIELPSAPVVVQRLHDIMRKDTTGAREIARIVEADQALTARVLRVVNSPFYGLAKQITAVSDAIKIMGIKVIHQLVLAASVIESFGKEIEQTMNVRSFWLHSLGTGLIAKHLIRTGSSEMASEALTSGILHDIGRLLYAKADPKRFTVIYSQSKAVCDLKREEELFGMDHQQVGAQLASRWNFPDTIREAIEFHHEPDRADRDNIIVAAVSIADLICHALQIGDSASYYVSTFSPEAWKRLGIDYSDLKTLMPAALEELSETKRALLMA